MAQPTPRNPDGRNRPHGTDKAMTPDNLSRMAEATSVRAFSISRPRLDIGDTAILGRMNNVNCHSGLHVHATDTVEAHDLSAEWEMPPACTVAVMLEGELEVSLDGNPVILGGGGGPTGHIWALTEPGRMIRRSRKGTRVRKVIITVPWAWIEAILSDRGLPNANLAQFARGHRTHVAWAPSAHAVALAEQIVNPARAPEALQNMSVESRAIEILREAVEHVIAADGSTKAAPCPPLTRTQARALTIRTFVRANLERNPSLKDMARDLGLSIGSMQAAFKAAYGRTVADYCRELRLQLARDALERDGISVAQAAYIAGYSSPANFATAFKRQFGLPPSDARS